MNPGPLQAAHCPTSIHRVAGIFSRADRASIVHYRQGCPRA